jgi:two-component system, NarL family, sensor histidine kinase UhpB
VATALHLPEKTDGRLPAVVCFFLRMPLLIKVVGANFLLFAAAISASAWFWSAASAIEIGLPLALSFAVTTLLVWLALRPIFEIETTAQRVATGDFGARVTESPLADRDALRLSRTMNRLLDRVETDRARIQYLAGRSVRARDVEREAVARELRESFAQMMSAIALQLGAAVRVNRDPEVEQQLERTRGMIAQLTEEMRGVAESLYPGTLGDLGLPNAIQALARRTRRQIPARVDVNTAAFWGTMASQAASALYRVADEALRNVVQHADARSVHVELRSGEGTALLEIEDDGRGVDMRDRDPMQAGLGLFSARAVLALAGGDLQISSAPGRGTRVTARVPIGANREPRAE